MLQGTTLVASYTYNYQGQRSRKVTTAAAPQGAQTVVYHYDVQGHLIAETSASGGALRTYVWRDAVPVAQIEYSPARHVLYFDVDHLNTPRAARDASGQIVWQWESDAFGATLANEDPSSSGVKTTVNLRLPGQYFDQETNLHYNYFRDYDPATGRYVQSDPIGLQGGINTYSYVGGNPLSYIDPFGLWSVTFGMYRGAGGQITFGNDSGNGFMTGRFGFGLGGGISYNPNGGIPGPVPQDRTQGGAVLSCSAKANFNAGPLSAYLEKGVARNYSNEESASYRGAGYNFRDSFTGISASASVGGQVTVYSGAR